MSLGLQIKMCEFGGLHSEHGEITMELKILIKRPEMNSPLGRPRRAKIG
jgi:hypothetical protein